ncbi:MAG: response regulator [Clostridiales bacterium]|nr:response regulator [Clostridiales bacterium]
MLDILENNIQKSNILIVDDVVPNLVVLTDIIREAGYTARPVTSVKQAMEAILVLEPQLILLDISMPDMDGFEWCEILKKDPKTRDIPIIFISALNSTKDKIHGFQLGAVDFISKPFEVEEVTLRVNTHLKIHTMQQELELYNQKLQKLVNEQVNKIIKEQKNLIYAMARISEAKDNVQTNHIENIAKNSKLVALCLLMTSTYENIVNNDFVDTIELAAPLHDIGKIALPDIIIQKKGNLTQEEEKIFQQHAVLGAKTLSEAYEHNEFNEFLRMAIEIAHYHHERWDGMGYPEGLKAEEIPIAARIVTIVCAYDRWMMKEKLTESSLAVCRENVIKRINDESGKRFDPKLVEMITKIQRQLKD